MKNKILPFLLLFSSSLMAFNSSTKCKHLPYGSIGQPDQILCKEGYVSAYDFEAKNPSYVAYILTDEIRNRLKRKDAFSEDKSIPKSHRAQLSDYKRSGYDRGHMAPSASMSLTRKSQRESFLLSNMTPQLPGFNQQGWRYLENDVRHWAIDRGEIYVVTGAIYGGDIKKIGQAVYIPTSFYKVVIDMQTNEMTAYLVPHRKISKKELPKFVTSVDLIERITGYDFFKNLPNAIEDEYESMVGDWD